LAYTDNIREGGKEGYTVQYEGLPDWLLAMTTFHISFMTENGDK
jgi:hypothetical protein